MTSLCWSLLPRSVSVAVWNHLSAVTAITVRTVLSNMRRAIHVARGRCASIYSSKQSAWRRSLRSSSSVQQIDDDLRARRAECDHHTHSVSACVMCVQSFLAWDASRVSSAMFLWSYHPLRARWHSDFMLFNRYADVTRRVDHEDEDEPQKGTVVDQAQFEARWKEMRDRRLRKGIEDEDEEEAVEPRAGQTYGSGAVGTGATTRRRKGPLAQLAQEREQQAREKPTDARTEE
jgi:hypothetical protein